MKAILLATAIFIFGCVHAQRKAVFVIVDGIPADVIEKLQPPTIMEISKAGGYTRSKIKMPTVSAPGYNNIITGVWSDKHNVVDNDIEEPNYFYWHIFRIVKAVKPSLKTAVFSTWTDNRTKLIGEGLEATGGFQLDYSFDGLELDTVAYPHDENEDYIRKIDQAVAANAAGFIQERGPDLSWVYLQYTDDAAHRFGDSPQFNSAVLAADSLIKKIWDAVTLRGKTFNEDWLVIITTDHGRDAETGKGHGGPSDREATTWIATNSYNLNEHFKQTPGAVDILPSICNHLNVKIPDNVRNEQDGMSFIGAMDFSDLKAQKQGNKIVVEWKSHAKDDRKVEIFISVTDHFKMGDADNYLKVGEVPLRQGKYPVSFASQSSLFKILVKTASQSASVRIVK